MKIKPSSTTNKPPDSDQVLFSCVCSILLLYILQWCVTSEGAHMLVDQQMAVTDTEPSILDGIRFVVRLVLG